MRDDEMGMGEAVMYRLKRCGKGVAIYPLAKIIRPEVIEVGDFTQVDDFTLIYGGAGITIGRYNHIASFVSIVGGGKLITEDYVGIAAGSRLVTGTDHYGDGKRISPLVPIEHRNLILGTITIRKDAFVGTNCVIHPNVTIGEGAIIGSNSLVLKNIEPWSINVGSPCRKIGERPRVSVDDI